MIHKFCKSEENNYDFRFYHHYINYLTKSFAKTTLQKPGTEVNV